MLEDRILKGCSEIQEYVILLAHANAGEAVAGYTKLQKMMFVLSDMLGVADEYGFEADNYGPYSETVAEEARGLVDVGVLYEGGEISLTEIGRKLAGRIAKTKDARVIEAIARHKEMFNDMSTKELLSYVYASYPAMTTRSLVCRDIERNIEKHVMSMLRKEKITLERASELMGMDIRYVMKQAAKMNIRVLG